MGKLSFFGFLREQLSIVKPATKADLSGQTVVVIGANTGLGFQACNHFARMNPSRIIMACRSQAKGEAAVQKLRQETDYKGAELWIVDLSDFSSVIAFADKFEKDGGRLDILVANAATIPAEYIATSDGWEISLQVNCLSLFLLELRLLPRMIKTATEHNTHPRLVTVTSEVHFWSQLEKTMPEKEKDIYKTLSSKDYCTPAVMKGRYEDTKPLAERLGKQSPVIVNGVNPGFCISELARGLSGLAATLFHLVQKVVARTSEQGSRQLIYAAVEGQDNLDQLRGAYISNTRVSEASDYAIGKHDLQDRLWGEVIDILGKLDPHIGGVVDSYLSASSATAQ
ncbi:hypothetical protein H0H87_004413 [Tephrocybe sp. NHM501043]|nr:hypothetical protein H0H87_004413 [Tephrocybe sp. NHM501043]